MTLNPRAVAASMAPRYASHQAVPTVWVLMGSRTVLTPMVEAMSS